MSWVNDVINAVPNIRVDLRKRLLRDLTEAWKEQAAFAAVAKPTPKAPASTQTHNGPDRGEPGPSSSSGAMASEGDDYHAADLVLAAMETPAHELLSGAAELVQKKDGVSQHESMVVAAKCFPLLAARYLAEGG